MYLLIHVKKKKIGRINQKLDEIKFFTYVSEKTGERMTNNLSIFLDSPDFGTMLNVLHKQKTSQ